ncbi:MAG: serine hydrolase [Bacillota bacterium]
MLFDQATRETKFAALCEYVKDRMKEHQVPGVGLGLLIDGEAFAAGFGITSIENPLEVTGDTLFQIGSVTKTVTGTAMMRLVERGDLDLEGPVRRYLPDFRLGDEATAATVTVRHLITHVAGWPGDVFTDTGSGDDAVATYVAQMAELPQVTPLGELWTYNNAAFVVAGRVIEAVTGKTYEAAVRELVLEPLGMTHSFFFPNEVMLRRFVVGHMLKEEQLEIARPWNIPRSSNPAGGLVCSVQDLLRYARFHLAEGVAESGDRLLAAERIRQMHAPVVAASNGQQMALSWFVQDVSGVRFLQHGGATWGQMALLWLAPEKGVALALLTNGQRGTTLNNQVSAWVREHYLGVRVEEPALIDVAPEELAPYAGRYQMERGGTILIEVRGSRLMLQSLPPDLKVLETKMNVEPPAEAALIARDKLVVLEGPMKGGRGEFLTTSDGRRWFRIGVRAYCRKED